MAFVFMPKAWIFGSKARVQAFFVCKNGNVQYLMELLLVNSQKNHSLALPLRPFYGIGLCDFSRYKYCHLIYIMFFNG